MYISSSTKNKFQTIFLKKIVQYKNTYNVIFMGCVLWEKSTNRVLTKNATSLNISSLFTPLPSFFITYMYWMYVHYIYIYASKKNSFQMEVAVIIKEKIKDFHFYLIYDKRTKCRVTIRPGKSLNFYLRNCHWHRLLHKYH